MDRSSSMSNSLSQIFLGVTQNFDLWPHQHGQEHNPARISSAGPMVAGMKIGRYGPCRANWDTAYGYEMIHDTRQRHFFNLRGPSSHIHAKSHRVSLHAYRTHLHRRDQHAALRSDGHDHCGHARPARAPIRRRGSSSLRPRRLAWLEGET